MHPILFEWGEVHLYSYGLLVATGFLVAVELAARAAQRQGLAPASIRTLSFVSLLGGLVGARLFFILTHWAFFRVHPLEIFRVDHGGLVFYGGFIGGMASAVVYILRSGLPLLKTLDLMMPPLAIAHAFGRIGCFLNGCCYGKPTRLPWGIEFLVQTGSNGKSIFYDSQPRHPTQLYEALALVVLFGVLKFLQRKDPPAGTILFSYGLLYGFWRFLNEFLRADNPIFAGGLTLFQWMSLALVLGSLWGLRRCLRSRRAA